MTAKKKGPPLENQNARKAQTLDAFLKIRISSTELRLAQNKHGYELSSNIRQFLRDEA